MPGEAGQAALGRRLACGFTHSLAIAGTPQALYVWGKGDPVQAGKGGPLGRNWQQDTPRPQPGGTFSSPCVSVQAAGRYSALLHADGSITLWAAPPDYDLQESLYLVEDITSDAVFWSSGIPQNPTYSSIMAVRVACGSEHILLTDKLGRLFSWGIGMNGVLGHGNLSNYSVPKPVEALKGVVVTEVAAGSRHSLCCSNTGKVYAWGNGENGKLGLGDAVGRSIPTLLESFTEKCRVVACGESHSALITHNDELHVWGSGAFGRLGLGFESGELAIPTKVQSFTSNNEAVLQVSLGMMHSACIAQDRSTGERKLYMWGSGSNGKLGNASFEGANSITPVEAFRGYRGFEEVCCGQSHTLVLLQSGEILAMGYEGASWLGDRKKSSQPVSFSDYLLNAFINRTSTGYTMKVTGYTSSQIPSQSHKINFSDIDRPDLSSDHLGEAHAALVEFIKSGAVPHTKDKTAVDLVTVQRILWSRPWDGAHGVSETALLASREDSSDLRYQIRLEYSKMEDLRRTVLDILEENQKITQEYFLKQIVVARLSPDGQGRSQRDLQRDHTGIFSFRGYLPSAGSFRHGSIRDLASLNPVWRAGRANGRKNGADDPHFFTTDDFNAASVIMSHLISSPEKMKTLWNSLQNVVPKREEDAQTLFLGLCRDIYDVENPRSRRLLRTALKGIGLDFLQRSARRGVHNGNEQDTSLSRVGGDRPLTLDVADVYRDGVVPRVIVSTYHRSPIMRQYLKTLLQPLIDRILSVPGDLDLDPFSVAISVEANRSAGQNAGKLVYLKPREDELPLDIREANEKRMGLFNTRMDVRQAIEPKLDIYADVIDEIANILVKMCESLPLELNEVLLDYHRSLAWCFYPKETAERCTLILMRMLFHITLAQVFLHPEEFGLTLPEKLPRDFGFNLNQVASVIDRCFVDSKQLFEQPWYGLLGRLAVRFRAKLRTTEGDSSIIGILQRSTTRAKAVASSSISGFGVTEGLLHLNDALAEGEMLRELTQEQIRYEPVVLFPSRRTLEFLRHRVTIVLADTPGMEDAGVELLDAIEHFYGNKQLIPQSERSLGHQSIDSNGEAGLGGSNRRRRFAAGRTLSGARFLRRSTSGLGLFASRRGRKSTEEKRINFWDFSDDWGYSVPIKYDIEVLTEYMDKMLESAIEEKTRVEATGVVTRATELLLTVPLNETSSLWDLAHEHFSGQEQELYRYVPKLGATGKPMDQEGAYTFSYNVIEKVLANHVERIKARAAIDYKAEVYNELLTHLQGAVREYIQRRILLEQYRHVIRQDNSFTQNRKAVEAIAGSSLTPVIKMVSPELKSTRTSRNRILACFNA